MFFVCNFCNIKKKQFSAKSLFLCLSYVSTLNQYWEWKKSCLKVGEGGWRWKKYKMGVGHWGFSAEQSVGGGYKPPPHWLTAIVSSESCRQMFKVSCNITYVKNYWSPIHATMVVAIFIPTCQRYVDVISTFVKYQ